MVIPPPINVVERPKSSSPRQQTVSECSPGEIGHQYGEGGVLIAHLDANGRAIQVVNNDWSQYGTMYQNWKKADQDAKKKAPLEDIGDWVDERIRSAEKARDKFLDSGSNVLDSAKYIPWLLAGVVGLMVINAASVGRGIGSARGY